FQVPDCRIPFNPERTCWRTFPGGVGDGTQASSAPNFRPRRRLRAADDGPRYWLPLPLPLPRPKLKLPFALPLPRPKLRLPLPLPLKNPVFRLPLPLPLSTPAFPLPLPIPTLPLPLPLPLPMENAKACELTKPVSRAAQIIVFTLDMENSSKI